ncbi:MAG: 30S ribosomal protein S21 [Candidatus Buchananbacteria bacterium RIFCSPHIGHO2_02_FULL_56_16]|uniref:Small ribosomal subunit protein bS21 n=1 Tax=Candidatus Buchananbacteria bacterium RIFCSPHIGHO2_02_FULL_56_16 TaxID=1797542 RepID=A0A1G1YF16_9BACT|nr:MAG: 30S ribosomal protein S21 [Candidatus Buchananbacteria bacterium RIFCSPHIGHO2_02_FULL_56_16]
MAEIKRKKGETFESFVRRFNRKLQQSGKLIQSRKIRFYERPKNRTKTRMDALRRKDITQKREYLKKIGKLKEEGPFTPYRKKTR